MTANEKGRRMGWLGLRLGRWVGTVLVALAGLGLAEASTAAGLLALAEGAVIGWIGGWVADRMYSRQYSRTEQRRAKDAI